ncbi:MAG: hypothetical protein ACFE68_05005 [Candidatus Hodarchaeota archaeon]
MGIILYTGYEPEELEDIPLAKEILALVDVALAGRYDPALRLNYEVLGSANKKVLFQTDCYTLEQLNSTPITEILINMEGINHIWNQHENFPWGICKKRFSKMTIRSS